jgi:hypothetical protein
LLDCEIKFNYIIRCAKKHWVWQANISNQFNEIKIVLPIGMSIMTYPYVTHHVILFIANPCVMEYGVVWDLRFSWWILRYIFFYVMPCSLVDRYLYFRGIVASVFKVEEAFFPEGGDSRFLQIICTHRYMFTKHLGRLIWIVQCVADSHTDSSSSKGYSCISLCHHFIIRWNALILMTCQSHVQLFI